MAPSVDIMVPNTQHYYSSGLRGKYKLDDRATAPAAKTLGKAYLDITYEVDRAKTLALGKARVRAGGLETDVPPGWPRSVEGPLVWSSDDFVDEDEYICYLTNLDKEEIVAGVKHFNSLGLDGDQVNEENFPLPNLGKKLKGICDEVYDGKGFSIIRGFEPDAFSVEDMTVAYLGISAYIGDKRGKQDQRGSMLMHVIQKEAGPERERYSLEKPFHTDTVCDTLCLFTRSASAEGGRSILASGWMVYNELAATRPDLIHTLAKPDWPFDTYGREPPYYQRPVLYWYHGKIIFNFSRRLLIGNPPVYPRSAGIPGLTEAQAEALDVVHLIACKHEIRPTLKAGDIRFVNNMAVLHRREAFQDNDVIQRHLIRLWLNNEMMCWKLPATLRLAWARVFEDEERDSHWDIVPPRENGKLSRVAGSCD